MQEGRGRRQVEGGKREDGGRSKEERGKGEDKEAGRRKAEGGREGERRERDIFYCSAYMSAMQPPYMRLF